MRPLLYSRYVNFTFSMKHLDNNYCHPDITFKKKVFNSDVVIMRSKRIFYKKSEPNIKGIEYPNETRSGLYPELLLDNINKILE